MDDEFGVLSSRNKWLNLPASELCFSLYAVLVLMFQLSYPQLPNDLTSAGPAWMRGFATCPNLNSHHHQVLGYSPHRQGTASAGTSSGQAVQYLRFSKEQEGSSSSQLSSACSHTDTRLPIASLLSPSCSTRSRVAATSSSQGGMYCHAPAQTIYGFGSRCLTSSGLQTSSRDGTQIPHQHRALSAASSSCSNSISSGGGGSPMGKSTVVTLARGEVALNGSSKLSSAGQRAALSVTAGPDASTPEASSSGTAPAVSPLLFDSSRLSVDFDLDSSSVDFDGYGLSGVIDSQELRSLYGSRNIPPDSSAEEAQQQSQASRDRLGTSSNGGSSNTNGHIPTSRESTPQSQQLLPGVSLPSEQGSSTIMTSSGSQAYNGGRLAPDQNTLRQTGAVPVTRTLFARQSPARVFDSQQSPAMQGFESQRRSSAEQTPPTISTSNTSIYDDIDWRVKISEMAPDINDSVSEFAALTYAMMQQSHHAPVQSMLEPAYVRPSLQSGPLTGTPNTAYGGPRQSRLISSTFKEQPAMFPHIPQNSVLIPRTVSSNLTLLNTKKAARRAYALKMHYNSSFPSNTWVHGSQTDDFGTVLRDQVNSSFRADRVHRASTDTLTSSGSSSHSVRHSSLSPLQSGSSFTSSSQRDTGSDQSKRGSSSHQSAPQNTLSSALVRLESLLQSPHASPPDGSASSRHKFPPLIGKPPGSSVNISGLQNHAPIPQSVPSGTPASISLNNRSSRDSGSTLDITNSSSSTSQLNSLDSSSRTDSSSNRGSSTRDQAVSNSAARSIANGSSSSSTNVASSSRAAIMPQFIQSRAVLGNRLADNSPPPPPPPPPNSLTTFGEGPSPRSARTVKRSRQQTERRLKRQLERSLLLPDPVVFEGHSPYPILLLSRKTKLNPSELSTAITAAQNLSTLQALHSQYPTSFHLPHITMMLRRLTRLRSQGAIQHRDSKRFKALWSAMLSRAFFMSHKAKPHHAMYAMLALTMSRQGTSAAEREAASKPSSQPNQTSIPATTPPTSVISEITLERVGAAQPDISLLVSTLLLFSERHLTQPQRANGYSNASSGGSVGSGTYGSLDWASTDDSDVVSSEAASAVVASAAAFREHLPAADATRLIVHIGKLCAESRFSPSASWMRAVFAGSLPLLPTFSISDLVGMLHGVSVMKAAPPAEWLASFYTLTQRQLLAMSARDLSSLIRAVAGMPSRPPTPWIKAYMSAAADSLDDFDAPGHALLAHSLGRLRYKPKSAWTASFLDSAFELLHDFRPNELSLLMRGLGFLAIRPDDEWLDKAFLHTGRQMWGFSPPQLANTAWAFALLGLQPPREWLGAFCKRLSFVRKRLDSYHRRRALAALQLFKVPDLKFWFRMLCITQRELKEGGGYASLNADSDPSSSDDDSDEDEMISREARPSIRSAQLLVWKKAGWGPYKLQPIFTGIKVKMWQRKWLAKLQGASGGGQGPQLRQVRLSSPVFRGRSSLARGSGPRRRKPSSAPRAPSIQSSRASEGAF